MRNKIFNQPKIKIGRKVWLFPVRTTISISGTLTSRKIIAETVKATGTSSKLKKHNNKIQATAAIMAMTVAYKVCMEKQKTSVTIAETRRGSREVVES